MPFVYDETEIEWPEDDDDFEPPPPRADQFVYIPPPDFGGASAPVRFSVIDSAVTIGSDEPQAAAPGGPRSYEEERRLAAAPGVPAVDGQTPFRPQLD